jgi:hypothetical protein
MLSGNCVFVETELHTWKQFYSHFPLLVWIWTEICSGIRHLSEESFARVLWMLLVAKVIHLERSVPTILYSIHEFPQPGVNQSDVVG